MHFNINILYFQKQCFCVQRYLFFIVFGQHNHAVYQGYTLHL